MIKYKLDLLAALKSAGYSAYKLRQEKLIGEATLTKIRGGGLPSWHELDIICGLLGKQPGDIVAYEKDVQGKETQDAPPAAVTFIPAGSAYAATLREQKADAETKTFTVVQADGERPPAPSAPHVSPVASWSPGSPDGILMHEQETGRKPEKVKIFVKQKDE